jgi:transcriptional regulator with XRE-family HTH domain
MTERPDAPPEGELIKAALAASGLSQRKAAKRAGISDTRWRQIVAGYQSVDGKPATFRSNDTTLARMAHAVGVRPEELAAAGRPGAAEVLREISARQRDADAAALLPGGRTRLEERWLVVRAALRSAREGLSPAEDSTLADRVMVLFDLKPDGKASDEEPPSVPRDGAAASPARRPRGRTD